MLSYHGLVTHVAPLRDRLFSVLAKALVKITEAPIRSLGESGRISIRPEATVASCNTKGDESSTAGLLVPFRQQKNGIFQRRRKEGWRKEGGRGQRAGYRYERCCSAVPTVPVINFVSTWGELEALWGERVDPNRAACSRPGLRGHAWQLEVSAARFGHPGRTAAWAPGIAWWPQDRTRPAGGVLAAEFIC